MYKKIWSLETDLCRCCHSEGSYKSLYTPYFWLDVEAVYGNMLRECFDVELVEVAERLACAICDGCIQKLQDAAQFKHQVQQCEIRFRNMYKNVTGNIPVPVIKRLKYETKTVISKVKGKRKVVLPRKYNVFLKNNDIEIVNSNESLREDGYGNNNMKEIVHGNRSMEGVGYSNNDMRKLGSSYKNIEENGYSKEIIKEFGDGNKDMAKLGSSKKSIGENVYSNDMTIDDNNEYDSDTPISRLSKEFAVEKIIAENKKSDIVASSIKEICKAPQYSLYCDTKPVSERKRIRVTCETVLKDTTVCPFRHHKSWFRCFYCTQDFMDIDKLRQHTLQNHNAEDIATIKRYPRSLQIDISDFRCKICGENLTDVKNMVEHFLKVHDKMVYKECIADYKVNTSPYTCHLCRKQYHVFRTLTTHLNEHYANYICDVCGKPFLNTKRLKVHKRTHESGNFPCTECGKILKTKTSKANHMESHSKRVLKCHLCSKPMKHYNDRIKHMSEEHNITHKFKCVICGREYQIKHYLATHMRQTHGHKNKKCLECGMAFITNHGLKKHMLKHSGEKGFPCNICSKAYARSYTLKEHMRGHDREKADH